MEFVEFSELEGAPGQNPAKKLDWSRPLAGVEVLVAVIGPSPGEGGGKNKKCTTSFLREAAALISISSDSEQCSNHSLCLISSTNVTCKL